MKRNSFQKKFRFSCFQGVCELEKDAGSCSKYVNVWAYDRQQGKCVRFWYGSCEGNGNRFETEQQCQETCVSPKGIGNDTKENFHSRILPSSFRKQKYVYYRKSLVHVNHPVFVITTIDKKKNVNNFAMVVAMVMRIIMIPWRNVNRPVHKQLLVSIFDDYRRKDRDWFG